MSERVGVGGEKEAGAVRCERARKDKEAREESSILLQRMADVLEERSEGCVYV